MLLSRKEKYNQWKTDRWNIITHGSKKQIEKHKYPLIKEVFLLLTLLDLGLMSEKIHRSGKSQ